MAEFSSFTYRVPDNHRHLIVIDIEILVPISIQGYMQNQRQPLKAKALIDTGASRSAISNTLVQAAKLVSYEKCTIRMAKGEYISSVYVIDIMFPHKRNLFFVIPLSMFFLFVSFHRTDFFGTAVFFNR